MTEAPADRTYWHVPGARSWHALDPMNFTRLHSLCGRWTLEKHGSDPSRAETADRVPSNGHLCGSCARVIASRTDIENHSVTPTSGIS